MMRALKQGLLVGTCLLFAACSAEDPFQGTTPPKRQFVDLQHQQYAEQQFAVDDPMEGTNKQLYKFNAQLDRYVLIPIVDAYTYITPEFVRDRVKYFFQNVSEVTNFSNAVLQADMSKAGTTLGRFAVNTTVGLLGTFEVAESIGLQRQPEDFGQTLGVWGVGPGPYLVLPFFGPSNVRDTAGIVVDLVTLSLVIPNDTESEAAYKIAAYGVYPLNMRYVNKFRYFETGTPFEYEFVRYGNTRLREMQIEK